MSRKVINIDENVYAALKKHCEQGGYKIAKFVERLISDKVGYEMQTVPKQYKINKR